MDQTQPAADVQDPTAKPKGASRLGLYVFGALLLVATLTVSWFWEDIEYAFAARPEPSAVHGTWVFDQQGYDDMMKQMGSSPDAGAPYQGMLQQAKARYAAMTLTIGPDSYTLATGSEKAVPVPCTFECYPPNVVMAQTKTSDKNAQQMMFSVNATDPARISWNAMEITIPLKRK